MLTGQLCIVICMYAGLFTSSIEDGYLIPTFDKMYFLKASEETVKILDETCSVGERVYWQVTEKERAYGKIIHRANNTFLIRTDKGNPIKLQI